LYFALIARKAPCLQTETSGTLRKTTFNACSLQDERYQGLPFSEYRQATNQQDNSTEH
jgi:hypothetical protein